MRSTPVAKGHRASGVYEAWYGMPLGQSADPERLLRRPKTATKKVNIIARRAKPAAAISLAPLGFAALRCAPFAMTSVTFWLFEQRPARCGVTRNDGISEI